MIPVAPPASRVALGPGDQACCLLLEVAGRRSRSGTRQTVRGVARVRVESIEGDVCHVVVLAASGGRVGEQLTYPRAALYATKGDEWRAFKELVAFLWALGTGARIAQRGQAPGGSEEYARCFVTDTVR